MKPLLASKADLEKIRYPVLASPKLDGIRCVCVDGVPMSRTLKPIPNNHIRGMLSAVATNGLDGELMVVGDFNKVQSAVMRRDGAPRFVYNVFDCFETRKGTPVNEMPFEDRLAMVANRVRNYRLALASLFGNDDGGSIELVPHVMVHTERELLRKLEEYIAEGYEGLMVRDPDGPYKFGRSTTREGILLKVKKFFDAEGTLVEIIEKMHNKNEARQDELGNTKRSLAKAGMVPAGTAGALVLRWHGKVFKVGFGPGIDDAMKQEWWDRRRKLEGKQFKFTYQELSKDGVPRFGKALGIRHPDDL